MQEYLVLIVDDHTAVREGVKTILSQLDDVACESCESIEQLATRLSSDRQADLLVLDMEFPGNGVFDIFDTIRDHQPEGRILIYTCHEEPWLLARLDDSLIKGFVSKRSPAKNLLEAVTAIREGRTFFDPCYASVRDGIVPVTSHDEGPLSDRERQVLEYMTQGFSTREIADMMHLSVFTIKTYRSRLAKKLHAKNAVDVVVKGKKYRDEK